MSYLFSYWTGSGSYDPSDPSDSTATVTSTTSKPQDENTPSPDSNPTPTTPAPSSPNSVSSSISSSSTNGNESDTSFADKPPVLAGPRRLLVIDGYSGFDWQGLFSGAVLQDGTSIIVEVVLQ